jgi:hypothetical protein
LWAYQGATSQLVRIVENAAGLAVDWSQPVAGVETIVVDRSNQVFVHAITPGNDSSVVRFGPDGTPFPTTVYPVRLRTIDVDTHGGFWGQHYSFTTGIGLVYQNSSGGIGATVLNSSFAFYENFTTHGDTTGSVFARLGPPGLDSDGDGSTNRVEAVRGTDPFSAASAPPVVTITAVAGSMPPAYAIAYHDPDLSHAGLGYVLGCALSATTGIAAGPFGARPTVPLDLDVVLMASLAAGPPAFVAFSGGLDPGGSAAGLLTLPPGTPPGITVFIAGATFGGGACLASSNAATLTTP